MGGIREEFSQHFYTASRSYSRRSKLNLRSLRKTLRDSLAGLKPMEYGTLKSIGVEELLGYLVKHGRFFFALQTAAGVLWNLDYKHRYRAFGEYFNALLRHYVELPRIEC